MTSDNPSILPPTTNHAIEWLANFFQVRPHLINLTLLAGDASPRRYYRVQANDQSYALMIDDNQEQRLRFLTLQRHFNDNGIRVPIVYADDNNQPYVLLEDFGDTTLFSVLSSYSADAIENKYFQAINALVALQKCSIDLPQYTTLLLTEETDLFINWYCAQYLNKPLTQQHQQDYNRCKAALHDAMVHATQVPVHRDYHSRNLMCVQDNIGMIDFQDAVMGCCAYDMVSLLRDAYVERPIKDQIAWLKYYWTLACAQSIAVPPTFDDFYQLYHLTSIQRALKVLGIFARLAIRDSKQHYLNDMPLVYCHLMEACDALGQTALPLQFLQHYAPPCKQ